MQQRNRRRLAIALIACTACSPCAVTSPVVAAAGGGPRETSARPRASARGYYLAIASSDPASSTLSPLTAEALDQSLALGRQYLLNIQRPDGSFIYELDANRGVDLNTRHAIREMSALW